MQRVVPAVVGAMVASLGLAGSARAADVPQGYIVPAPAASLYNWTGIYVGGQGGYSWGTFDLYLDVLRGLKQPSSANTYGSLL